MTELAALDGKKYVSLATYRKNGKAVMTPVWFAAALPGQSDRLTIYVYTTANSGKVKRLRRNPGANIAPCDARGNVTGAWIGAMGRIVQGEEFNRGMRLIDRKYCPWKQLLDLSTRLLPRHERVVIALDLIAAAPDVTSPVAA